MPSGFQQDSNQLSPSFYRVVLTLGGNSGTGGGTYPTTDGTDNGAVNPYNWDTYSILPLTNATAYQLARGNMRWQAIMEEVSLHADCQVIDVEVSSSDVTDANSQPTDIAFTVRYDRDSFILDSYKKVMLFEAPSNTSFSGYGSTPVASTVDAIRELVTRGIIRGAASGYTRSYRVYVPDTAEGKQDSVTVVQPDTADLIWFDVAVNRIDGTELNNIAP
jgi:hypothetical protein